MVSPQGTIVSSNVLKIYNVMKKLIPILIFLVYSFTAFAQSMYSDAVECMNNGEYADAKVYWEALNDRKNTYGNKIAICNTCIKLQAEAKDLIAIDRFTKAIEKYKAILNRNPSDKNARNQIARCERLRTEYLAANQLQTYTNSVYSYTFKHPAYMSKSTSSTNENTVFGSSDYKVRINVTSAVYNYSQTNTQLLSKVVNSYNNATITYKVIKDNWVVVSGYLADGRTFYDKSIISTRKSQYNEYVKILVSAVVTSPRSDGRGSVLAECISNDLSVNSTGPSVKINETDDERWQRAKRLDTKEGYNNYLAYAPYSSPHKEEAKGRKSLWEAREQYTKALQSYTQTLARPYYESAKKLFKEGEAYMTASDRDKYVESYYQYCLNPSRSLYEIKLFMTSYSWHPKIKVVKGCLVKAFCSMGLYSSAKDYVKVARNYPIWFSESTSYTQKQWLTYIKTQKKKKSSSQGYNKTTTKYGSVGKYKKGSSIGYTLGVGTELSFPKLDVGAFPQVKLNGGLGDNYNRFNLLADLTIGYSGDFGSTFKAKIAPRWNVVADEFFLYAQPEAGYDFLQGGAVYGGRIGFGWEYLGSLSVGYLHSKGFGGNLWQLSYVYNWYW